MRETARSLLLVLALSAAAPPPAMAQHAMVTGPNDVEWGPVPPSFPPGAQVAVLAGNPFADGAYVLRLKMPAGYQIPAHNHPTAENVTVISGSFHAGMGDKLDQAKAMEFRPGGFASLPPQMNHFAWTTVETVVQVHGAGPFAITYANPADDPSKNSDDALPEWQLASRKPFG